MKKNNPISTFLKSKSFPLVIILVVMTIITAVVSHGRFFAKGNILGILFPMVIQVIMLCGIGGIFNACRLSQGALTALTTNQFTGLTAAILGGISFGGGVGGMGGAFVGLLILNTFQIGMSFVGVNPFWVNVFSGVLLLVALALDFIAMSRKSKALAH